MLASSCHEPVHSRIQIERMMAMESSEIKQVRESVILSSSFPCDGDTLKNIKSFRYDIQGQSKYFKKYLKNIKLKYLYLERNFTRAVLSHCNHAENYGKVIPPNSTACIEHGNKLLGFLNYIRSEIEATTATNNNAATGTGIAVHWSKISYESLLGMTLKRCVENLELLAKYFEWTSCGTGIESLCKKLTDKVFIKPTLARNVSKKNYQYFNSFPVNKTRIDVIPSLF